ncbi:ATPase P, partial [Achromatium sp. WMS2]
MRKLLNGKVLVRKLLGIEAAGSLNMLFSDKTGTLTKGQLQVSVLVAGDNKVYEFFDSLPAELKNLVGMSLKHNTIAVLDTSDPNAVRIVGADRTENALLQYVTPVLAAADQVQVLETIAFNSARKFSAVHLGGDRDITLIKGAAEIILSQCTHYWDNNGVSQILDDQSAINVTLDTMANRSMRLIAIATSQQSVDPETKLLPNGLTLVGIVGLRD